ncbi:MAG: T9SS type A sorting domain-containing protein [Bacteroidota bacterium]
MKKNLLLVIFISIAGIAFTQNLRFYNHSAVNVSGDTITVTGLPGDFEIVQELNVFNAGSYSISVKVKKRVHYFINGTTNTFCWVLCYTPSTIISTQSKLIAAGDTASGANGFSGHYSPVGNSGESMISYTAFDMNNTNDSVIVYVKFVAGTNGVNDYSELISVNTPYPVPADQQVYFNINLSSSKTGDLAVYNIIGNEIYRKSIDVSQKKININTSAFNNGIYLYCISDNKKTIKTGKFVVSH